MAKPGETVVFSCKFGGSPAPTVTWTKNGAEIKNASRFLVIIQKGYTEVHVEQITKTDGGDYMVTLRNSGGYASAWAKLAVIGRWNYEHENEKGEMRMRMGMRIRIGMGMRIRVRIGMRMEMKMGV